jgi:hypothetical protein
MTYDIYLKNELIQNHLFSKTIFCHKSSFVKTTFMSHFKKFYLKVVFTKDDFHMFFKFKKNLVKSCLLCRKSK